MVTKLLAFSFALVVAASHQTDDLTEIATKAVEYVLRSMGSAARPDFKVEVQVAGVFDSVRSAAVAKAFGVTAARESQVIECDRQGERPACRMVGTTLFLQVRQSSATPGNRVEVRVTVFEPTIPGGPCGGIHRLSQALELVKSTDGWAVSKPLTVGTC